jgi:hypothetical protein
MPDNTPEEKTWEQRFEDEFQSKMVLGKKSGDWQAIHWTNKEITLDGIKAFIQSEIASAKSEGRREAENEDYCPYCECPDCTKINKLNEPEAD